MTTPTSRTGSLAYYEGDAVRVVPDAREDVRTAILAFVDMAATSTGQDTFYNTREEQQAAIISIHDAVYGVNRGLYAACLCLPGITDLSVQIGLQRLLDEPYRDGGSSFLTREQEDRIISCLVEQLPPQRLFKMYGKFRTSRVNNRRTSRIILRSILSSVRLPWWSVKYRNKLREALVHAWGVRVAHGVKLLVSDPAKALADGKSHLLRRYVGKYTDQEATGVELSHVAECVCFIMGGQYRPGWSVPVIKAFHDAHTDIEAGAILPHEVLEGLRGRFHNDVPAGRVLELTTQNISDGQKMALQATAQRHGVEMDFDPTRQDLVKLYVYMLDGGRVNMNPAQFQSIIKDKADRIARNFPLRYGTIGIVLDCSISMYGSDQAKNRPMAVSLAMRDVLVASATQRAITRNAGADANAYGIVFPSGDTSLAEALVDVIEQEPDAIYIITDGYENAPAGRVDEVIQALRRLRVMTPIYQVTPVMAAEKAGIRQLSPAIAPLPITRPESIGLSVIRAALTQDVETGIHGLLSTAKPITIGTR